MLLSAVKCCERTIAAYVDSPVVSQGLLKDSGLCHRCNANVAISKCGRGGRGLTGIERLAVATM